LDKGDVPMGFWGPRNLFLISLFLLLLLFPDMATLAQSNMAVEERIVDYLKRYVTPGKPFAVSELYNNVFTAPEEKAVK